MSKSRATRIEERIKELVKSELSAVDMEELYRDMLDDCYTFKGVGGPFEYMQPSRVLAETDPVAFRCGLNDYIDGDETVEEYGDEYFDKTEMEKVREQAEEEIDDLIREEEDGKEEDGEVDTEARDQ